MSEPLDWPTIKILYPELRDRLVAGDISARAEFARLAFGAEIISETHSADKPSPIKPPSGLPSLTTKVVTKTSRPSQRSDEPELNIDTKQSPNPPF